MVLLSWTNPLTNLVTSSLAVRGLTSMRAGCKFEGISDVLPLDEIQLKEILSKIVSFCEDINTNIEVLSKRSR